MLKIFGVYALGLFMLPLPAFAQRVDTAPFTRVVDLPLGDGLRQRVLYVTPTHPRATLVMLPGGTGDVGVQRDGDLRHDDNFVVRTRAAWVAEGYAVLIPDTIDQASLRGIRSSPAYGRAVGKLIAYARAWAPIPVFLVGTSQGTIVAVNGASHAPGMVAGLVLTEAVSVPGRLGTETVFDADPEGVRVPVLIVANRDDGCDVAPPSNARRIAEAMTGSPEVQVVMVTGGAQKSGTACGSLSPHGYYRIEKKVVAAITTWLQAHGG